MLGRIKVGAAGRACWSPVQECFLAPQLRWCYKMEANSGASLILDSSQGALLLLRL